MEGEQNGMTTVELPDQGRMIITFATQAEFEAFKNLFNSLKSASVGGLPATTQVILDINAVLNP